MPDLLFRFTWGKIDSEGEVKAGNATYWTAKVIVLNCLVNSAILD